LLTGQQAGPKILGRGSGMPVQLVLFDLETTGLSPLRDEIIQIAAVRMTNWEVDEEDAFFSYVNPGRPIPPWISYYTGITDADVQQAPRAGEVLRDFSRYVGGTTLVAHNGHRFDMKFLAASCEKLGLPTRPALYWDSIWLSWQVWGRRGVSHGLDAVLGRLELNQHGLRRHDARSDVMLLAKVVRDLWQRANQLGAPPALASRQGVLPL
jgi:DNA polymerase III epsilon subunit family exonuclease